MTKRGALIVVGLFLAWVLYDGCVFLTAEDNADVCAKAVSLLVRPAEEIVDVARAQLLRDYAGDATGDVQRSLEILALSFDRGDEPLYKAAAADFALACDLGATGSKP